VKVSNHELQELSFSGSLVGDEGIEGGDGPVSAQGSWHIALPQVKEETDAGTMTLAPDPSGMVFVMLGGNRYSAVLPLRPGAGRKLVSSKWREVKEAPLLETLPQGGTVSAPLHGVGQFWQAWKKKKAALAAKKHAAKKPHTKALAGAHHRTQQMDIVNPLAMAAPQAHATKAMLAQTPVAAGAQQPVQAPPAPPQSMQVPASAVNDPIESAILAVAQSHGQVQTPVQQIPPPVARAPLVMPPVVPAPMARPASPPVVPMSPYSAPVSAVDDVITAAAISNAQVPSSWTNSVSH